MKLYLGLPLLMASGTALAHGLAGQLENIQVHGHRHNIIGVSISASEGVIGEADIAARPMLRTGEILEFVPGMVVTQHSGSGKANQYFLRGFNLDHGTDFNTSIDGMPVNMRSHGHGQGYTDLNFIIPELVQNISYAKGSYDATVGDFSGAGSAVFSLKDSLSKNLASVELGQDSYQRLVAANNLETTKGNLLLGLEHQQYDGPWTDVSEDIGKTNLIARYAGLLGKGKLALTAMAYDNSWNGADQIPQRAVTQGIINELGSLDTSVGGESKRYSLSASFSLNDWLANAYVIDSDLDLYSNFTYLLDNPVQGDQFQQVDNRRIFGGAIQRSSFGLVSGMPYSHTIGVQVRTDDIDEVALNRTRTRQFISAVRSDAIDESSYSLFADGQLALSGDLTAHLGWRYDYFDVDVKSDRAQNTGSASDGISSLKATLSYAVSDSAEIYLNAGQGYHSNDARGATSTLDPVSTENISPADLLVRSEGAELGIRLFDQKNFNLSAALWMLELDSELLYVGDAGTNEASRPSQRKGIEISAYYWLAEAWSLDMEAAWTHARYADDVADEGRHIEGSVPLVISAGISYQPLNANWQSAVRIRHFGSRVLDSFDEQQANSTTVVNWGAQWHYQDWALKLDVLNLLDSDAHDIDYFYASRLSGEPEEGVEDLHYHPVEPRTLRLSISYHY